MNLYKVCITIKEVSLYFSACFKAFFVCRDKDEITIFENAVSFDRNIDNSKR